MLALSFLGIPLPLVLRLITTDFCNLQLRVSAGIIPDRYGKINAREKHFRILQPNSVVTALNICTKIGQRSVFQSLIFSCGVGREMVGDGNALPVCKISCHIILCDFLQKF